MSGADFFQRRRPQQAAHVVGPKRRSRPLHRSFSMSRMLLDPGMHAILLQDRIIFSHFTANKLFVVFSFA
jgi:hypothetical protein